RRGAGKCDGRRKYPGAGRRPTRGGGSLRVAQRWKLAVIGILAVGATPLASPLPTAYLMRPPAPAAPALEPSSALEPSPGEEAEPRAPIVRITPPRPHQPRGHKTWTQRPADEVVPAP